MAELANYLEDALVNHLLRNTALSSPGTNVWIALNTNSQGDADSATEVTGGSYVRIRVQGTGAWDAPSNGVTANTAQISFTTATANWGTVQSVSIKDSSTSTGTDNLLAFSALDSNKIVNSGDQFIFSAGNLTFTLA